MDTQHTSYHKLKAKSRKRYEKKKKIFQSAAWCSERSPPLLTTFTSSPPPKCLANVEDGRDSPDCASSDV